MNTNTTQLQATITQLIEKYIGSPGSSKRGKDYETGYIDALKCVRDWVIPAFETQDLDEAQAIEESMTDEIEDLKTGIRMGIIDPDHI